MIFFNLGDPELFLFIENQIHLELVQLMIHADNTCCLARFEAKKSWVVFSRDFFGKKTLPEPIFFLMASLPIDVMLLQLVPFITIVWPPFDVTSWSLLVDCTVG